MRRSALPTLVVALVALLAFAVAAGTVGNPATTGTAEERGVERDAQPRTEFPRVEGGGGGGVGGIRGLVAAVLPDVPRWALLAGAAGTALLLVVLWRTAGRDAPDAAPGGREATGAPVEGVPGGGLPRDAAQVPADNGVFRAWRRLAEAATPRRRDHRTPADYAAAAREAGADPDAVDELTALFRRVRYGPAAPTPERERRAREALERAGLDDDEGEGDDETEDDAADAGDDAGGDGG